DEALRAMRSLAGLYEARGDMWTAERWYLRVVDSGGERDEALRAMRSLAGLYEARGDMWTAERWYLRVVESGGERDDGVSGRNH
ncbi:tetratricopeptide repeat protein, partial [Microbispora bryophytorum]